MTHHGTPDFMALMKKATLSLHQEPGELLLQFRGYPLNLDMLLVIRMSR